MGLKGHAGPPGIGLPGQKGDRGNLIDKNLFFQISQFELTINIYTCRKSG